MSTTSTPSRVSDTAAEDLVLKVRGSSRDGQVLRLKSPKCTIGSGSRCTLRLRARGVRPIHCLVVRGSSSTVVRRWSPDTRLNGRTFTDAELVRGDRLSVGTIELEVLGAGRPASPDPAENREAPLQRVPQPQIPGPQAPDPSDSDRRGIGRLTARLALANRQGRQRVRRVLDKLRSANREVARLREAEVGRSELQRQLKEQAEALKTRQSDLDLQREEFERERIRWSAEQGEAEEDLRQRGQKLEADRAGLATKRDDLKQWGQEQQAERTAAASPQQEKEEPPAEAERLQQDKTWEEQQTAGAIDIVDVFRRMGSKGPSLEPEPRHESAPEPPPPERPTAEQPPQPAEKAGGGGGGGGEESIEDYMSRLMERVHAIRGSARPAAYQQAESRPEHPPGAAVQENVETPQPEESAVAQLVTPPREPEEEPRKVAASASEELASEEVHVPPRPEKEGPRAVAPERRVNLSAMRDLANLSSRAAIDRYARRQARFASLGKLLMVPVAAGSGTVLLRIWLTRQTSDVTLYAAVASFLVALLWAVQSAGLAGRKRLRQPDRGNQKSGREPVGQQAVVPVEREEGGREEEAGGEALCGSEPDARVDDPARDLEQELKALLDG